MDQPEQRGPAESQQPPRGALALLTACYRESGDEDDDDGAERYQLNTVPDEHWRSGVLTFSSPLLSQ